MYWLDTTFLVLLTIGALFGARTGLVWQIARVVSLVLSLAATLSFHEPALILVRDHLLQGGDSRLHEVLAYVGVFFLTYFACYLMSRLAYEGMRAAGFLAFDRLLGGCLGMMKMGIFLAGICMAMVRYPNPTSQEMLAQSRLAPVFAEGMQSLVNAIPQDFKHFVRDNLGELWNPAPASAQEPESAAVGTNDWTPSQ